MGDDLQGFRRLWERICKVHETLGEDSQGFMRLWERICKDWGDFEDSQGFGRLWERICKDLHETLGEDLSRL